MMLEAASGDFARLSWTPAGGTFYRLCVMYDRARRQPQACFPAGQGETAVGIPPGDNQLFLLGLQACYAGGVECSELVDAGSVGRRTGAGYDFYATAQLLADGQVRLSGYSLREGATIAYHQARPGRSDQRRGSCPGLGVAGCAAATYRVPGSLVGVTQEQPGGATAALTFELRDAPHAALLFDDGTGLFTAGRLTSQTVLDEFHVRGNFFVIGRVMRDYPGAIRALFAAGHRVGNHTFSHPFLTRMTDAQIGQELDTTEQQYRALVPGGTTRPCFRAPNGAIDRRVNTIVEGRGYHQIDWTVSSMDWTGISADRVTRNALDGLYDGALISFHTQEPSTIVALRTIVPTMLSWGYVFDLVC